MALGARAETLSGFAGLGDLVLTCTGALSRNRQLGIELGKGRALAEILASTRMVAEGVGTAGALLALAAEHRIELPITAQVEAILHRGKSPREAMLRNYGTAAKAGISKRTVCGSFPNAVVLSHCSRASQNLVVG